MGGCPGEDAEAIEDAIVAANVEPAYLRRTLALIGDREKIESATLRALGNRRCPPPVVRPWDGRVVTPEERERRVGEPTEIEKLKRDTAKKLKKAERRMSKCGRVAPPRARPRRCSQKPKTDNWLGRRRSRARAVTIVRRASQGAALRSSMLLERVSVCFDHKRDSIRRASVRRRTMEQTGAAASAVEAAMTVTGVNLDNVVDMSVAVQNATDAFLRLNAEHLHQQAIVGSSPFNLD